MDGTSAAAVVASAPAPAAAPSTAPPAKSSPVSAPSSGDLSIKTPKAPTGGAPKADASTLAPKPPEFSPIKFKAKFNGVEEDVEIASQEELQRYYQQARLVGSVGKQRKEALQQAEQARQQYEALQQQLKADPFAAMKAMGVDPEQHVRNLIMERARIEKMTPEERLAEETRRAAEPHQRQAEQYKRQLEQIQQQQHQEALERWADNEYQQVYEPAFKKAFAEMGIEPDEDFLAAIGTEASTWLEAGVQLDPAAIVRNVHAKNERDFWGRLGKQKAEAIRKRLSPEQWNELLAIGVREYNEARNPARKPGQQVEAAPPPQAKKREYIDEAQFRKLVSGR